MDSISAVVAAFADMVMGEKHHHPMTHVHINHYAF